MNWKKELAIVGLCVAVLVPVLSGCFSDPVKSELEEYVSFEFEQGKKAQELSSEAEDRSITSAQTKEELVQILQQRKEHLLKKLDGQRKYEAKTPQIKEIHAKGITLLENKVRVYEKFVEMVNTPQERWERDEMLQQRQLEIDRLNKEYQRELRSLMTDKHVRVKI
jgi:hypothetical protein